MDLVIKLSEEDYKKSNEIYRGLPKNVRDKEVILKAIANGTPLPKGHGRLIDVDELDVTTITTDDYSGNEVLDVVLKEDIDYAPTIIEADKAESEDK